MALKDYSKEEMANLAMVEVAAIILEDANKELHYREIYDKVVELKEFTEQQAEDYYAQFYTDLNMDGRFLTSDAEKWGLKRWYPVEQIDQGVMAEPEKKKKSKKKQKKQEEEELDVVEEDEQEAADEDDDEEVLDDVGWDDETSGSENEEEDGDVDDEEENVQ